MGVARQRRRKAHRALVNAEREQGPATLIPSTFVGKLQTLADWHREVGRLYRQMRKGELPTSVGTRLVYVCDCGARMAKALEETDELQRLRAAVEAVQSQGTSYLTALPTPVPMDMPIDATVMTPLTGEDA